MRQHRLSRRAALGPAVLCLLSLLLAAGSAPGDDDDDEAGPQRLVTRDGASAIHLTRAWQAQSGVEVFAPQRSRLAPEVAAQGEVVDLGPLLDLRSRYHAANADLQVARAALASSGRALERLQLLHREAGNVSARQLQEAEAARNADSARAGAAEARLADTRYALLQAWGPVVGGWGMEDGAALEPFLTGREVLMLVSLPPGHSLPEGTATIAVAREADRARARSATLVSPAPAVAAAQGETWFFRAGAEELRVGMRVRAWIPTGQEELEGVVLPAQAVVWHGGRPWAYRRSDGEYFSRHLLTGARELGDDYFVPDPSLAGAEVVSVGAQTLLSEEFRGRIPDEDDDP